MQAVIAQKSSKVDTDHQKISMSILTMFRVAKQEEKKTDKWLHQDFSQGDTKNTKNLILTKATLLLMFTLSCYKT